MIRHALMTTAAALALSAAALPAHAQLTIMYPEWLSGLVEAGIADYEAATGASVEAVRMPGDGFDQRVALDLSAGTAADVVVVDSFMVSELASAGYLHPLDEQAGAWDQYQHYLSGLMDVVSYDGDLYALPTDTDVRMLWYNRAVFEQAGIEQPWTPRTWDDVIEAAQTIKDETGIENAFILPAGTKQGEAATMQGFYMALLGADVPDDDRNRLRNWAEGKWIGDSPGIRRTLELYHEVYIERELGTAAINYATDIGAAVRELMRNDELGILASGSWENVCIWDCTGVNLPTQEERDEHVAWTPWPGSGHPGTRETTNISGGWAIAINANAPDKDAAFELMTTIFDHDNFVEWTVNNRRMAVRTDVAESEAYSADSYLAQATELAAETTGRDTYPGYQVVSALIQQATADILDGVSVDEVVEEYYASLVDEFGEDGVITYE